MRHFKDANNINATREALFRLNRVLDNDVHEEEVEVVVDNSTQTIRLPRDVAMVLREVLANRVAGRSVEIIPQKAELTTQQAADLLNVSRPHVVKLMDDGVLRGHKVGTHRRIYASAVQEYKHQREIQGRLAADELTALTEDMDLY